ncbi:unnamed protein product [Candidula unifasciata]|uniref:G-protein coupled receptors family 1 profile domain-containing protein n=1 Tax=Candidula unifasciata TaxID=100452 RepID=A0A8S3ZVB8_9EUPU|nr:unnamed protein product [Candidula unifasciata]
MSRKPQRSSKAAVYLIGLAVADTCALYSGLLRHFVRKVTGWDFRHISEVSCKINIWLVYASLDISVWILVALTIERFLSVFFQHPVKIYCSRMSSKVAVTCIVISILVLDTHILYGYGDSLTGDTQLKNLCTAISDNYNSFFIYDYPWIEFCFHFVIPIIVLTIGNFSIGAKVLLVRRSLRRFPRQPYNDRLLRATSRRGRLSRLTVTLFALTLVFMFTEAPCKVFYILKALGLKHIDTTADAGVFNIMYTTANLSMYVNKSINFILYCFTGSRFRHELMSMFKKQKTRTNTTNPVREG